MTDKHNNSRDTQQRRPEGPGKVIIIPSLPSGEIAINDGTNREAVLKVTETDYERPKKKK